MNSSALETLHPGLPFSGGAVPLTAQPSELPVARTSVLILAAGPTVGALCPVDAATRKVRVPNRYDGSWTIVATTTQGPCSASTNYQVRIKDSDASIPGDIDIDGGVSANGAVQATIISGEN